MAKAEIMTIPGATAPDRIFYAWKNRCLDKLSQEDNNILDRITEVEKRFREKKLVKKMKKGEEIEVERPWRWADLVEWLTATYGISNRQAYADIEMAKQFFLIGGGRTDKEFARGYRIMQGEELMYQCLDEGDRKTAAAFFKELVKLDVLDRKDEGSDTSAFEPMKPVIIADPSELGFPKMDNPDQLIENLKKTFKKGTIDKMLADADDAVIDDEGSEDMAE